jgi:hypothetical protein
MTVILNTYFVDKEIADKVENLFLFSFNFPWYIRAGHPTSTILGSDEEYDDAQAPTLSNAPDIEETGQLVHSFVQNGKQSSDAMLHIEGILLASQLQYFQRIKANLLLKNKVDKNKYHTPHFDREGPHWTAIYYVNDSDGDTFFFDETGKIIERISPEKGKVIVFPGETFHAGSSPIKTAVRSVINMNAESLL